MRDTAHELDEEVEGMQQTREPSQEQKGQQAWQNGLEGRQDAKARLAGPLQMYNLQEMRQQLLKESEWRENGRDQIALYHCGALRAGLFGFQPRTGIVDHKVNGHVTIQVLEGKLRVTQENQNVTEVPANTFIAFDALVGFSMEALEECFAIITFCQADGIAEPARGNERGKELIL